MEDLVILKRQINRLNEKLESYEKSLSERIRVLEEKIKNLPPPKKEPSAPIENVSSTANKIDLKALILEDDFKTNLLKFNTKTRFNTDFFEKTCAFVSKLEENECREHVEEIYQYMMKDNMFLLVDILIDENINTTRFLDKHILANMMNMHPLDIPSKLECIRKKSNMSAKQILDKINSIKTTISI